MTALTVKPGDTLTIDKRKVEITAVSLPHNGGYGRVRMVDMEGPLKGLSFIMFDDEFDKALRNGAIVKEVQCLP